MSKDYNNELKKYFEYYINQMGIDETFRPLLVEVMLRRSIEFDLEPEEIQQDMCSLMNNLVGIEIGKMPKSCPRAAGVYTYDTKKITISEEYIKKARTPEDFENIYEIFTHEVFHALARDEYGESKISTENKYTKERFFSLEEAIVEKAADRCVYSRQWNETNSPFFHQNKFGYSDITYITDIIEATYGVTEKAFLRHAMQGRQKAAEFLASISGENVEDTIAFLDGIEINYSRLHQALYTDKFKGKDLEKEVRETMASSLLLCSWKLNSNISRINTNPDRLEDAAFINERYKYGYDKMLLVTKSATEYFDWRFRK